MADWYRSAAAERGIYRLAAVVEHPLWAARLWQRQWICGVSRRAGRVTSGSERRSPRSPKAGVDPLPPFRSAYWLPLQLGVPKNCSSARRPAMWRPGAEPRQMILDFSMGSGARCGVGLAVAAGRFPRSAPCACAFSLARTGTGLCYVRPRKGRRGVGGEQGARCAERPTGRGLLAFFSSRDHWCFV